ncbi:MAG: hypothetical protein M1269_11795 [Chloroflexi bacterium]|nr:hypothetical protein [Chloroflexota bacterium]
MNGAWIVIEIFILLAIILFIFVVYGLTARRRLLKALVPLIDNPLVRSYYDETRLEGTWESQGIRISLFHGGASSTRQLIVYLGQLYPFTFRLSPENEFNIVAKKLGIEKDLETGDEKFDKAFVIHTGGEGFKRKEEEGEIKEYLGPERLDIIRELKFSELKFTPNELIYYNSSYSKDDLRPEKVESLLKKLRSLAL